MLTELYDQERITEKMLASTRKETILEDIRNLMVNLNLTAEQAIDKESSAAERSLGFCRS